MQYGWTWHLFSQIKGYTREFGVIVLRSNLSKGQSQWANKCVNKTKNDWLADKNNQTSLYSGEAFSVPSELNMQLLLFTYCLQYICLQHLYSRWCKSHVWASCLFAFFCVSGTPSTVTLNHLFYVKPSLSALFPWWTSIRITMSRGAWSESLFFVCIYPVFQASPWRDI